MEKKTIGGLIAALRKANGMTQRELAEKLNVSDKTVSRWERDESAPDLSLIPVIAEIFDITCDELLRGERTAFHNQEGICDEPSPKAEKQRKNLIASSLRRFQNRSWISVGVAFAGLLAAATANLGFLRAYIGFFLGTAFYLTAAVLECIWVGNARFAVSEDSAVEDTLLPYRRQITRRAEGVFLLIITLFGITFALLYVNDAYLGLSGEAWLIYGLITGAVAALVSSCVLYILHGIQYRKGRYPLAKSAEAAFLHNRRWKRICGLLLLGVGLVTVFLHISLTQIWGPFTIMKGITFNDYESFIAYMEQDVPAEVIGPEAPAMDSAIDATYYDEFGNEISEEDALRETLELPDGTVACEYIRRNNSVISVQYSPHDGTILPIRVFTQNALEAAHQTAAIRHVIFAAIYCVEVACVLFLYLKKRKKA